MHELIYSIIYSIIYHFWWFWSPFVGSALFQVTKNGTGSAQIEERTPKTFRNIHLNCRLDFWFMRFHFQASTKPILTNHVFSIVLEPFSPYTDQKTKRLADFCLQIYNFEDKNWWLSLPISSTVFFGHPICHRLILMLCVDID